jgi:hypothetical protein
MIASAVDMHLASSSGVIVRSCLGSSRIALGICGGLPLFPRGVHRWAERYTAFHSATFSDRRSPFSHSRSLANLESSFALSLTSVSSLARANQTKDPSPRGPRSHRGSTRSLERNDNSSPSRCLNPGYTPQHYDENYNPGVQPCALMTHRRGGGRPEPSRRSLNSF